MIVCVEITESGWMILSVENKHTASDLKQMQSLPLEAKIRMTKRRIQDWYDYWNGQVYVSFSGGKDSTVLKHIVDSVYSDVPAVFVNTGLEYPEIQKFVREVKSGKYDCFNSDVEILRPEMRFDEVIKKHGYPVVSKENSLYIRECQNRTGNNEITYRLRTEGIRSDGVKVKRGKIPDKWMYLIDAPFKISEQCCDIMKKNPAKKYGKKTGRKPFVGTMATESALRERRWMKTGCNAFDGKKPKSQPMSFWTEQDVLEYIVKYDVPYASVYGQIKEEGEIEGQMFLDGFHTKLCTTGAKRTGCMFCMFGCHLEKEPNRFQVMKETHPNQYAYCMKSVEEGGLGIKEVLQYIGVPYE